MTCGMLLVGCGEGLRGKAYSIFGLPSLPKLVRSIFTYYLPQQLMTATVRHTQVIGLELANRAMVVIHQCATNGSIGSNRPYMTTIDTLMYGAMLEANKG